MRATLNSHPAVAVPGESHFISGLARTHRRRRFEIGGRLDAGMFLSVLNESHHYRDWGLPDDEVMGALTAPPATDVADGVRRVYALYARRRRKPRYADKSPNYVLTMPVIARLLPEARFLHIVRDGRDVALSLLAIAEWGPTTVPDAALWWKKRLRAGRRAGRRLGARRYLEVRYEDLVHAPEPVLRTVCVFLDLEFDERLLDPSHRAEEVLASVRYPHHHERLRQPPTPGIREWKTEMERDDVLAFEALAGGVLTEMGYERRYDPVPRRARVDATVLAWKTRTRDARSRVRVLRRQATNAEAWTQLGRAVTRRAKAR